MYYPIFLLTNIGSQRRDEKRRFHSLTYSIVQWDIDKQSQSSSQEAEEGWQIQQDIRLKVTEERLRQGIWDITCISDSNTNKCSSYGYVTSIKHVFGVLAGINMVLAVGVLRKVHCNFMQIRRMMKTHQYHYYFKMACQPILLMVT